MVLSVHLSLFDFLSKDLLLPVDKKRTKRPDLGVAKCCDTFDTSVSCFVRWVTKEERRPIQIREEMSVAHISDRMYRRHGGHHTVIRK